ncbi:MAG: polymer-forming cytoskeletal protein [Verrucomicrobiales bacterium]|jgi:cytoskeletal protein CcmA (bactofilin family)|nr:polymer-forming cytoskeletal protein [Verrucomicrobiales bacterium]
MSLLKKIFNLRRQVVAPLLKPRLTQLTTAGVSLRGTARTTAAGYFGGGLEGDLHAEGELWLEPGGHITGHLRGTAFSIEGRVLGDIEATGEVALKDHSTVRGNITAGALLVVPGARFTGLLAIGGDEHSLALNLKSKS